MLERFKIGKSGAHSWKKILIYSSDSSRGGALDVALGDRSPTPEGRTTGLKLWTLNSGAVRPLLEAFVLKDSDES